MATLETITNNFIFFAGGVSFLVSLSELLVRKRRMENYLFTALLFCFGMLMFQIVFIVNRSVLASPHLLYLHMTFLYLVGPIGYFCYYLIILPRDTLPARMALYLLPAVIALVFDIYYMLMPAESQVYFLQALLYTGDFSQYPWVRVLFALAGVQIFLYLGLLFIRFLLIWIRESRSMILLVSILFLIYTIAASLLEISGYCVVSQANMKCGCFMMAFLFICAFLLSQRFPRFMQLIIEESEKKSRSKSLVNNLDVDQCIIRLKECMTEKKMFMNEDLTLKDLAEELSINVHQLSQILNERLATNFNNFVNRYRINESKMILLDEPDRSVISIAYAVGFNTKSSFYYAFSRFTGTTPQDYRRENL
jgi:AraC-like DNA-binding protein